MSIVLSPKHGVNPSLMQCFFCMGASGVALLGKLSGDEEAPRMICLDYQPCSECEEHMKNGVILVSVCDEELDRKFWHWHCPHCGNHQEVAFKEGSQAYAPNCESRDCRIRRGSPAMLSQGVGPTRNPYRTGGWVLVAEKFIKRVIHPPELVESMLKHRFSFVPDAAWDKLGLPRGKVDAKSQADGDAAAPEAT